MSESVKQFLFWLVALLILIWGVGLCAVAVPRKRAASYPTQGSGAQALLATAPPAAPSALALPKIVIAPATYYFAVTARDSNNNTSDFSNELIYLRTNASVQTVKLAWDKSPGTNRIAEYIVWKGRASGNYTNSYSAGTNLTLTVPLLPPALTNLVVTVTTGNATNLQYRAGFAGAWVMLGATNWTATNPPAPRYWRALGRKGTIPFISISAKSQ